MTTRKDYIMSRRKREITIESAGLQTVWRWADDKQEVEVDVYRDGTLILEWSYPKMPGLTSLGALAWFWTDQAVTQANA